MNFVYDSFCMVFFYIYLVYMPFLLVRLIFFLLNIL